MENPNQNDVVVVDQVGVDINPVWQAVELHDAMIEDVAARVEAQGVQIGEHTILLADLRRLVEEIRQDLARNLK